MRGFSAREFASRRSETYLAGSATLGCKHALYLRLVRAGTGAKVPAVPAQAATSTGARPVAPGANGPLAAAASPRRRAPLAAAPPPPVRRAAAHAPRPRARRSPRRAVRRPAGGRAPRRAAPPSPALTGVAQSERHHCVGSPKLGTSSSNLVRSTAIRCGGRLPHLVRLDELADLVQRGPRVAASVGDGVGQHVPAGVRRLQLPLERQAQFRLRLAARLRQRRQSPSTAHLDALHRLGRALDGDAAADEPNQHATHRRAPPLLVLYTGGGAGAGTRRGRAPPAPTPRASELELHCTALRRRRGRRPVGGRCNPRSHLHHHDEDHDDHHDFMLMKTETDERTIAVTASSSAAGGSSQHGGQPPALAGHAHARMRGGMWLFVHAARLALPVQESARGLAPETTRLRGASPSQGATPMLAARAWSGPRLLAAHRTTTSSSSSS
eukprot:scaffold487_cov344-Prasinococcus_capsulatus_cf.AAC.7